MKFSEKDFEDLEEIFAEAAIKLTGYEDGVPKPIKSNQGPMTISTFVNKLEKVAKGLTTDEEGNVSRVANAFSSKLMKVVVPLIEQYAESRLLQVKEQEHEEANRFKDLILAVDGTNGSDKEPDFFLVTPDGKKSPELAAKYISVMGVEDPIGSARTLIPIYSPRDPVGFFRHRETEEEGSERDAINTYIPPAWMKYIDDESVPAELPPEIDKLLNQITDEKDRRFFLYWTYLSLTSRANTFMILCGDPAVGKNRLKILLRALHGFSNSDDGREKMFSEKFNSKLMNNTFIFCDEFSYDRSDVNRMKEIPNGTMSIERKHKDATKATKIFCSVVIANNNVTDNYAEFNGRKFSYIRLSTVRLDKVMTPKEIGVFSKKVEDYTKPEFDSRYIAQVGKYILTHCNFKEEFPLGEHNGSRFYEFAHASMTDWMRAIISFLEDIPAHSKTANIDMAALKNGTLRMSIVRKWIMKSKELRYPGAKFPRLHMCFAFLNSYRDLSGEKIYTVVQDDASTGDFSIGLVKNQQPEEDDLPL